MAIKTLFFKQFADVQKPSATEIFAEKKTFFKDLPVQLFVIGSSHHIIIGEHYTERLSCEFNLPEYLSEGVQVFRTETPLGKFYTSIWQETFEPSDFSGLEASYLKEDWTLIHCFEPNSAFTAIRLTDTEIYTIHSYPEWNSLVFTKTRLP